MKLTWHGHSAFRIEAGAAEILIDLFLSDNPSWDKGWSGYLAGKNASQLAREAGAYVIGTGRAGGRQTALDFGAQEFVDLDNDAPGRRQRSRSGFRCHRRRHREAVCGPDSRRRNAGDRHRPDRGAALWWPDYRLRRRTRSRPIE